jgi:hypothetical protein
MSARPDDNTLPLTAPPSADDGDLGPDVLGSGFDDAALALIEDGEELFWLEQASDIDRDGDGAELPDELDGGASAGPIAAADTGPNPGADAGDLPGAWAGFDSDELDGVEIDEELTALELGTDDSHLPGELVDQPTKTPSRKVKAAGLGGLLGALPAPLLTLLDTITVPEQLISAIAGVLTVAGSLAAAYLTRERAFE